MTDIQSYLVRNCADGDKDKMFAYLRMTGSAFCWAIVRVSWVDGCDWTMLELAGKAESDTS